MRDRPADDRLSVNAAAEQSRDVAPERPTALVILGTPLSHALSPVMQNAALQHAAIAVEYRREEVDAAGLDAALARLVDVRAGGNVTIPHKEAVAARADRLTGLAQRVGAVNTFWVENGALVGHNTDVAGAAATIRALLADVHRAPQDIPVVLLGAGGSAAAVVVALADMGFTDLTIVARTTARARALLAQLHVSANVLSGDDAVSSIQRASLVINATPVGLRDYASPIDVALLSANAVVFDLVYRPGGTAWVRACREAGHRAEDGIRMLVEQGAAAFEAWFDVPAPRDVMWQAVSVST